MSLLSNNIFLKTLKNFLYPIIILIIILELFFQLIFFFDIKTFKKTILFFNPYCDQAYWNIEGNSFFDKNEFTYHPILTVTKKKNENFFKKNKKHNSKIIFYGSSFIDHKYFIPNYKDETNFAVKSYGIDQIYESYQLTKENFKNNIIIIGFLLEDIDRALFYQRNFPKLKYVKNQDNYELTNTPIEFKNDLKTGLHFYSYNFIKNISFLLTNEFNYKKSECNIKKKKDIFKFFINEIINQSKLLNQNIVFVTFNFKDDIKNPSWRYNFVKDFLTSKDSLHLDLVKIINDDLSNKNLTLNEYYNNEDLHLSEYGFGLVKKEINKLISQYR